MRKTVLAVMAVTLAGCGDVATEDARGYTKAPLENPGLLVEAEPRSAMQVTIALEPGLTAIPPEAEGAEGAGEAGGGEAAPSETQAELAGGVTQEQFDEGEQLFSGQGACMACHGPSGGGSQLGPDLTDADWLHVPGPDVDAIAEVIASGVSEPQEYAAPMPPMGGATLSEEQVQALAAYVASLSQR